MPRLAHRVHQLDPAMEPAALLAQLGPQVCALIRANSTLYDGNWDDLAEDLRRRLAGRPYLFRIDLQLDDVLGWAERLKAYEAARGCRLSEVLKHPPA